MFFQGKVIHKVRAALHIRFRGDGKPSTVFVDRGQGFYAPRESKIIREFKKAFQETELKPYYGDNASAQQATCRMSFCMKQLWHGFGEEKRGANGHVGDGNGSRTAQEITDSANGVAARYEHGFAT